MPNTMHCQCGIDFPFADEDRGFEVYCPSCGRACLAPETAAGESVDVDSPPVPEERQQGSTTGNALVSPASPPQEEQHSQSRVSVFSQSAESAIAERVVGQVHCLCGEAIPVRVEDFGLAVYCPRCGSEVQVGANLGRRQMNPQIWSRQDAAPEVPAPQARLKWVRSPMSIVVVFLAVASVAAASYFTWDRRHDVLRWAGWVEPLARENTSGVPGDFQPDDISDENIESLVGMEDPFEALLFAFGWQRGLREYRVAEEDPRLVGLADVIQRIVRDRRERMLQLVVELKTSDDPVAALSTSQEWLRVLRACQLPPDDERIVTLEATAKLLLEEAQPITLEMIAALLEDADSETSLVQAQMWQEDLRDRGVPDEDPRVARLTEVVDQLLKRLVSVPKPSPVVAEFRQAVDQLSQHLRSGKFQEARQTVDRIEKLLQQHATQLAPMTKRYLSLKAKLEQIELRTEGVQKVRALLTEAAEALATGEDQRVTDAWLAKAEAKFIARRTPMTPATAEELSRLADELGLQLQLARGKRAVSDAEACQGETALRNRLALGARALLEGLPSRQIQPFLEKIKPWIEEAGPKGRKASPSSAPATELGRAIEQREWFEAALDPYGTSNIVGLADACTSYHEATSAAERQQSERYTQLQKMYFDVLEVEITEMLRDARDAPAEEVEQKRLAMRGYLDRLSIWRSVPRWEALDGALREFGGDSARRALARASEMAKQNEFQEAIRLAGLAIALGNDEIVKSATRLQEQYKQEIKLRADRQAEAESIQKIKRFLENGELAACWPELERFLERYPKSEYNTEAEAIKKTIGNRLQSQFDDRIRQLKRQITEENWLDVFAQFDVLRSIAASNEQQAAIAEIQRILEQQKQQIATEFQLLGHRAKMFSEQDIIEVRRVSTLLLAIQADHAEARQLLEKAEQQGRVRAKKLVEQCERFMQLAPEPYSEKLKRAIWLDPAGPYGKKAAALLESLQ